MAMATHMHRHTAATTHTPAHTPGTPCQLPRLLLLLRMAMATHMDRPTMVGTEHMAVCTEDMPLAMDMATHMADHMADTAATAMATHTTRFPVGPTRPETQQDMKD